MISKIISGGQTGADQAALDFAIEHHIPHGGWIPKGRKTEDGILPDKYRLDEMPTASYPKRTEKNILGKTSNREQKWMSNFDYPISETRQKDM